MTNSQSVTTTRRAGARNSLAAGPVDEPRLRVSEALALPANGGIVEVYVDWRGDPIEISLRARYPLDHTWARTGPELLVRVENGIRPLLDAGWRTDGSLKAALRWDTELRL